MAAITSISELRNMPMADIRREVRGQRTLLAKMKIGIELRKEKDTGRYHREKRQLARMLTVMAEKQREERLAAQSVPPPSPSLSTSAA